MGYFRQRWSSPGGYKEVLDLAVPLLLSTGSWSIQQFVDRMFLSWYSPEAIAASMPASIMNFAILAFFVGTASYVGTFVSQYHGAGRKGRIGASVWQGVYFAILAQVVLLLFIPLAAPLFTAVGHEPAVQVLEVDYFVILCLGGFFPVATSAMAGFFSGRGDTWTVMWVSIFATGVNLVANYALIFGHWGFPELGIVGAGIGTVLSGIVGFVIFLTLMLRRRHREEFGTWSSKGFSRELFRRLMKFGLPNGVQFSLDILGFALFIVLVGRVGTDALAATNIAFNINMLAFMPMIGLSIAVSILVGQRLGQNKPELAEVSTWSAAHISFVYMGVMSLLYVAVPWVFIDPFAPDGDPAAFEPIREYGVVLLKFIAVYSLFDAAVLVFSGALKGAGDTRFIMWAIVICSWSIMVIPTYLATSVFGWGLFVAWGFATAYLSVVGVIFFLRFLRGGWKSMRVIEDNRDDA